MQQTLALHFWKVNLGVERNEDDGCYAITNVKSSTNRMVSFPKIKGFAISWLWYILKVILDRHGPYFVDDV